MTILDITVSLRERDTAISGVVAAISGIVAEISGVVSRKKRDGTHLALEYP